MVLNNLPISDEMLRTFQLETSKYQVLQKAKEAKRNGWPDAKAGLPQDVTTFFQFCDEIRQANRILMRGEQVTVHQGASCQTMVHNSATKRIIRIYPCCIKSNVSKVKRYNRKSCLSH